MTEKQARKLTLRPCPFCGSSVAPTLVKTHPGTWWVSCEPEDGGCCADGPKSGRRHSAQWAANAWNDQEVRSLL